MNEASIGRDSSAMGRMPSRLTVNIALLGSFVVTAADGRPVAIRGEKARALLGYLASTPGVRRSRERLAALLWGGAGQDRARQSLRQCLSQLRKALADADVIVLDADSEGISIVEGAARVDVCVLRDAAAQSDPTRWQAALHGYTGDLLANLSLDEPEFEDWLCAERREVERLVGRLCLQLADAHADAGDIAQAEAALHRRLQLDPCSEEAHRSLMQLCARTGRRAEAIQRYERCRDVLREQLDTPPSAQTERVFRDLLAADDAPAERTAPLPLPTRPAIAVLPFDNASQDLDQRYFSDGVAEDITVALSRFEAIMVIARSSAFSFRDRAVDVRRIGRILGVHYVLLGSVRRSGNVLRLSAQLLEAGSGMAVWANTYDCQAAEVFDIQDDLVKRIVATLVNRVEAHAATGLLQRPTDSLAGYECILKGKYYHHRHSARDNEQAQACLSRAIDLDPDSAMAHAWLACVLAQSHAFGADASVFERAYQSAQRARVLNDGESECHRILAAYYLIQRRYDDCKVHQARALALNPNDDRIVAQNGEVLSYLGQPAEAVAWLELAMRLNPYHPDSYCFDHGRTLYDAGRYAEALASLRRIAAPRADHLLYTAAAHQRAGQPGHAARCVAAARKIGCPLDLEAFARGLPYRRDETRHALTDVLAAIPAWAETIGP